MLDNVGINGMGWRMGGVWTLGDVGMNGMEFSECAGFGCQ